jgi:NAD(P)H-flavin reductase
VVFFFFHCNFTLTSVDYFIATGVIFSLTWLHSQSRIYFQHGFKKATIHLTTNGFIKVTIPTQTTWLAGQHYFIRFLGLGLHATTAHPFTVCSLPTKAHYYEAAESDLVFYIRAQGGLTARLASYAKNHPNTTIRVLLDGPYGGIDMTKLATSHKILAIAGGSGAGWLLPLLGAFLRRRDCVTSGCDPATGKMGEACGDDGPEMRVVLATRDMATRNWFEEAVADLLSQSLIGCCPSGLSVEIYCTGSQAVDAAPALSPHIITVSEDVDEKDSAISPEVRERNAESSKADSEKKEGSFTLSPRDFSTRPDLPTIVAATAATSSSSESTSPNNRCDMAVFCCGPLSMQSDVANAVAKEQLQGLRAAKAKDVYLHLEHFSWA